MKKIGLQTLREDLGKCLSILSKADRKKRQRKDKDRKCSALYSEPYKFTKMLFEERKNEKLEIS